MVLYPQKSIFETSSKLFYQNSLLESGKVEELDCLAAWEEVAEATMTTTTSSGAGEVDETARRPFLVLFRSLTSGVHQHDCDSPSFYNISEIACVMEMCCSLLKSNTVHVVPQDIGIIGAFRAQVSVSLARSVCVSVCVCLSVSVCVYVFVCMCVNV
jgi:hypothetical protein